MWPEGWEGCWRRGLCWRNIDFTLSEQIECEEFDFDVCLGSSAFRCFIQPRVLSANLELGDTSELVETLELSLKGRSEFSHHNFQ